MITARTPIAFADPLPEHADVVVIGAGVIGIATAYFLAKAGISVFVAEKGRVAGEQSSRNWGWVRKQGRDPAELPIMIEALEHWKGLSTETGEDFGLEQNGVVYLADDAKTLSEFEAWYEIAKQHQLDTRMLTASEVDAMIDMRPGQWLGGMITPSDARAEPWIAVPALTRAAQRLGASITENCAARTVETEAGRVTCVVTEHGAIRTDAVVLAGGAWSSAFLHNLGISLPQLSVRATVARTAPGPEVFAGNAVGPDLAFRRRRDGGYSLAIGDHHDHYVTRDTLRHLKPFAPLMRHSFRDTDISLSHLLPSLFAQSRWGAEEQTPFERTRVLDPAPSDKALKLMRKHLKDRLPKLADLPFQDTWAGMIDSMPDIVPVIDHVPEPEGLIIATGFSGHGFGIGPGAGRVVADLVQGKPAGHDLNRFRFARFSDGSPIDLGPTF
ncbi:MAG: FAD-binding oxidoreductase [Pseudomonadota bacterium]